MNKNLACFAATAALMSVSAAHADQQGQGLKQQLTGAWSLVSQYVEKPDGSRVHRFGTSPKGIDIFDPGGHYATILLRSDLPKIESKNAMTATPEENKAIIQGSTAFYGTWKVDDASQTLTTHVAGATFPNWDGVDQRRVISFSGDEMKMCVPGAQIGGTACAVWRRVR